MGAVDKQTRSDQMGHAVKPRLWPELQNRNVLWSRFRPAGELESRDGEGPAAPSQRAGLRMQTTACCNVTGRYWQRWTHIPAGCIP